MNVNGKNPNLFFANKLERGYDIYNTETLSGTAL